MKDDKLIENIEKIRDRYKTELEDPDHVQMSFIDQLNEIIKGIFKDDPTDIYTALTEEELAKWKQKRGRRAILRFLKNTSPLRIAYFALLVAITGFLVSEAVVFYTVAGVVATKSYIKAILTEVCFIFLSGYRATGKVQTFFVGILRACMFCLMIFVISSDVTKQGISDISEIDKIQKKIEFVEEQIESKDEAIEFYRKKGWGVNMRKQLDEKDKLVAELMELKQEQIDGKTEEISDQILYQTWGKAVFRVLLIFISILLTRRLFKF